VRACTQGVAGELARVWGLAMLTVGRRRLDGGRSKAETFRRWSSSKRAACRGWGAHAEAEVVDVLPCRDRRWQRLKLDLDRTKGCVRSRKQGGLSDVEKKAREGLLATATFPLFLDSGDGVLHLQRGAEPGLAK
jgi:hypothetical protein